MATSSNKISGRILVAVLIMWVGILYDAWWNSGGVGLIGIGVGLSTLLFSVK